MTDMPHPVESMVADNGDVLFLDAEGRLLGAQQPDGIFLNGGSMGSVGELVFERPFDGDRLWPILPVLHGEIEIECPPGSPCTGRLRCCGSIDPVTGDPVDCGDWGDYSVPGGTTGTFNCGNPKPILEVEPNTP